jgi:phosphoserine phosphatase
VTLPVPCKVSFNVGARILEPVSLLHVFDMDGTLLRGTTASVEIARSLGRLPEFLELETRFAGGALSTHEFAVAAARMYAELTPASVAAVFHASPWLARLADVMADIAARGEHSVVVTLSPDFFADLLGGMGVREVHASRFPPLPLVEPVDPTGILEPADKVRIVETVRTRLGLGRGDCIAYGDSSSDVPLFEHLTRTIAVNAGRPLRSLAGLCVDGDDLLPMYEQARAAYGV